MRPPPPPHCAPMFFALRDTQSLVCEDQPSVGEYSGGLHLVSQPSVQCYTSPHIWWFLFGCLAFVVWVMGVPVAIGAELVRAHRVKYVRAWWWCGCRSVRWEACVGRWSMCCHPYTMCHGRSRVPSLCSQSRQARSMAAVPCLARAVQRPFLLRHESAAVSSHVLCHCTRYHAQLPSAPPNVECGVAPRVHVLSHMVPALPPTQV